MSHAKFGRKANDTRMQKWWGRGEIREAWKCKIWGSWWNSSTAENVRWWIWIWCIRFNRISCSVLRLAKSVFSLFLHFFNKRRGKEKTKMLDRMGRWKWKERKGYKITGGFLSFGNKETRLRIDFFQLNFKIQGSRCVGYPFIPVPQLKAERKMGRENYWQVDCQATDRIAKGQANPLLLTTE